MTEARKTYRAVLSEPKLVIPEAIGVPPPVQQINDGKNPPESVNLPQTPHPNPTDHLTLRDPSDSKKRPSGEDDPEFTTNGQVNTKTGEAVHTEGELSRKRKKKRGNRDKGGAA